ncbi:MAG: YeeE/YedE thiosulfate transporter family protein [Bacteroidales bacterium]
MGPLIPQGFVNPDLNLFFAFVIGLGFGYVLEQAGFSSSRKLAGVFYGYDFVVLRVFFTAAITAMTGLLMFSYLGWIDYTMLYINPTFLWSAIVGGVIMGFGFILGGFCPGTSLVGAVIGKVDAMFFVLGMFIGIFLFGAFYQAFEPIYLGNNLGGIFVFDSLGMSREWFAIILIVVALTAFAITQRIEDRVNKIPADVRSSRPSYAVPALLILAAGTILIILPPQPRSKWYENAAASILYEVAEGKHRVCTDEVAYGIINGKNYPMVLVDVREQEDFQTFALPGALNVPADQVLDRRYAPVFESKNTKVVLYSFSNTVAEEAWVLLRRSGYENIFVMDGGLNDFFHNLFVEESVVSSPDCLLMHQARFREKAREYFKSGSAVQEKTRLPNPVIQIIEVEMPSGGGC